MSDTITNKLSIIATFMKKHQTKLIIGTFTSIAMYLIFSRFYSGSRSSFRKIADLAIEIEQSSQMAQQTLETLHIDKEILVEKGQVPMIYKLATHLRAKDKSKVEEIRDPFMPPFEPNLFIKQLGPKHTLLRNKFNIFPQHLLVVSKEFEHQESVLTKQDFKQVITVTKALKGTFFYNCGAESGASQSHKHFQVLNQQTRNLPIFKRILQYTWEIRDARHVINKIITYARFDFIHGIILINDNDSLKSMTNQLHEGYLKLHRHLIETNQSKSYNLIGCEQFLLMVPRKKEKAFNQLSVNSFGFMGTVLFKNQELMNQLLLIPPIDILRDITFRVNM